jgi:hypothetical protein
MYFTSTLANSHGQDAWLPSVCGYTTYRPAIHTVWLSLVHVNTIKELQVMFDGATVRVRAATNAPRPWNVLRSVHVSFRLAPLRAFVVNITSAISPPVGRGYPPAGVPSACRVSCKRTTGTMPLGIIQDRHLEHVPGTATLEDLDPLAALQQEHADGKELKRSSNGTILVPQPTDDPNGMATCLWASE